MPLLALLLALLVLPAPVRPAAAQALSVGAPGDARPSAHGARSLALRPVETASPARPFGPLVEDPWLGPDKATHVAACFLITLSSQYVLTQKAGWSSGDALSASVSLSANAGLGKELYDRYVGPTRYFSRRDLVADGLGIALAVGVILL